MTAIGSEDLEELDRKALSVGIDAAFAAFPNAQALRFELSSYRIDQLGDAPLPDLPWQPYDCNGMASLLDIFELSSLSAIENARFRAQLTSLASTTVQQQTGVRTELAIITFGPDHPHALALIEPSPLLLDGETSSETTIRTRIECSTAGRVIATDGPAGSYASAAIPVTLWAEHLIADSHLEEYQAALASVLAGEPYASLDVAGAAPGLFFSITIVRNAENVIIDFLDRSHQITALETLQRSQERFDQLSRTLPVGVFVTEAEGRVVFASERLREQLGANAVIGFNWLDCIHPDDQELVARAFLDLPQSRHFNIEIRGKQENGEYAWWRWAGSDVRNDQNVLEYVIGFVEDISKERELNNRLSYQARFDHLTDLPNRATLVDSLRECLTDQKPDLMTAVLFIDLDEFKLINDTQGHSVGDLVLVEVAQRFRRALRSKDIIGRFGGDEFVVIAPDISRPEDAEAIGRSLHHILSTPILADGQIISVNASMGIAIAEHASTTADQLIGDADIAMYESKGSGKACSTTFDAPLRARASQRFDMTAGMRHARRRRELRLEYQPIVDLKTNKIIGAEALARWDHPSMGRISPAVFIPLAEEIGLIDDIGDWVVEQACADLDRLRGLGLANDDFIINVNASASQFRNVAMLATSALASVDQFGLKPSNLRFELTESVPLTEIPDAANRIRQLTDYGFGLAIDDFGTGYSSLGYLTMLPFDLLKLDFSLTAQLEHGSRALAVVDSLTRMSIDMNFNIVAEGIESEKQKSLLRDAGVQLGQGHLMSRPIPLGSLIDVLEADRV